MNILFRKLAAGFGAALGLLIAAAATPAQAAYTESYLNPAQGWKILQPDYDQNTALDAISFEWDYWMIHSDTWNGIVGYVLANPRNRLPQLGWALLPNGNNAGIVGEIPGQKAVANYVNFGVDNTSINATQRGMVSSNAQGQYANYQWIVLPTGEPAARLRGRSADWEWDFTVTQDQKNRDALRASSNAFTTKYGNDVGLLAGEQWNVDMGWPRTNVVGTVKQLKTGQVIAVNGKGYREDSWGRYLLSVDGWDFMVFGETTANGVTGSFQTYHRSTSMDYFDVSFYDNGQLVEQRFEANKGELGWNHPTWKWDPEPNSCVPNNTHIIGKNSRYTIDVSVDIGTHQRPLLTNQTVGTAIFFIQEHFPTATGTIRRADGSVVTTFTARAGGEFARTKDIALWHSDVWCTIWGWSAHSHAFPN